MEDCCAVCAEPLEWTAYGPCGHTEACSKCVIRLRFVMDDKRCVICQQINPCVLVTRFMGSYTSTVPSSEFPHLGVSPPLMSILDHQNSSVSSLPVLEKYRSS